MKTINQKIRSKKLSKDSVKSPSSIGLKRHICSKEDHIPIAGPGEITLIQYFTCKQSLEITLAGRLQLLRKKDFCCQCLYPGPTITDTKHSEGRCRRDYTIIHATIHHMINFL